MLPRDYTELERDFIGSLKALMKRYNVIFGEDDIGEIVIDNNRDDENRIFMYVSDFLDREFE